MKSKQEAVKNFFDQTKLYTGDNVIISLRMAIIREITGILNNQSIIDIGCGNGEITLPYLPGNSITFVDLSEKMLEEVKEKIPPAFASKITCIHSSLEELTLSNRYDLVICLGVLAHVNQVDQSLQKLSELMKDKGRLIIQFTNSGNFLSKLLALKTRIRRNLKIDGITYKTNLTTLRQIRRICHDNQLKIAEKHGYFPVLPLMSWLSFRKRLALLQKLYKNKFTSKFANEVILVLVKDS